VIAEFAASYRGANCPVLQVHLISRMNPNPKSRIKWGSWSVGVNAAVGFLIDEHGPISSFDKTTKR
jgi:hypothetical protein